MTTPTSEDEFPPQHDVLQPAPDPFDDFVKVELTKPINMEQLTDEINRAGKTNVTLAVSGPISGAEAISETNPAELYVTPSTVGAKVVEDAIEKHDLDAAFGVPEHEQAFQRALQKVATDPTADLDDDEMRAAVRGLLIRQVNSTAPILP